MKLRQVSAYLISFILIHSLSNAQNITTKEMNWRNSNITSFSKPNERLITQELLDQTPPSFYDHPEFGLNPYDTPCEDCFEILSERTDNSRYFVKRGTLGSYFYRQSSNNDLHYKNEKGELITIDYRLKPTQSENVFRSDQQSNYTVLNLDEGYAELELLENNAMRFNSGTTLFSANSIENSKLTSAKKYNYSDFTAGNYGCEIKNAWTGIDLQMVYGVAQVKTTYLIQNLNSIDPESAYTVIDDEFEIPEKMKLMYDIFEGAFNANGVWVGQIIIVDEFEREFARIGKAVLFDDADSANINEEYDFVAGYKIVETNGNYHLLTYINNDYLTSPNRVFPITVDPLVTVTTNWTGTNGSDFTYCSFIVNALSPANATITNATIYFEIGADQLGSCGLAATSRCYKDKAQLYFSTTCSNSPTASPFYYYCIAAIGGCNSYGNNVSGIPWYETKPAVELITCLTPQCAAYNIPFTMYLRRTACDQVGCTTNCIRAERFDITLEGYTLEGLMLTGGLDLTAYTIVDCVTQTVTFTGDENYGVGPYTYAWTPSGGTGSTDTQVFTAGTTTTVSVTITDACGNTVYDEVIITDPCTLLPIELSSFSGYHLNDKNYLFWTTQSEQNNNLFKIERSIDGSHFEEIGTIDGAGNTNSTMEYAFVDASPFDHINYYRLKQVDQNDKYTYSGVVAIYSESLNNNSVSVNTLNAQTGQMNITITSGSAGDGIFKITDIAGHTTYEKTISIEHGINSVLLYPNLLAKGIYILSFMKNDLVENIKFEII